MILEVMRSGKEITRIILMFFLYIIFGLVHLKVGCSTIFELHFMLVISGVI